MVLTRRVNLSVTMRSLHFRNDALNYCWVNSPMIKAKHQDMYLPPSTCEFSAAFNRVSELLLQAQPNRAGHSLVKRKAGIVRLSSSNFRCLDEFKEAYLASQGPVICFIRPDEVHVVIDWIRDTDDLSLLGEPAELTQWRLGRIAQSYDRRLDPLTRVYSRNELIRALHGICKDASPFQPASLILMDIDHLKSINDRFGVAAGNQVLRKMGKLVQAICGNSLVSRTRGGEFAVMVQSNESIAKRIAIVIQETVHKHEWTGLDEVTASFGVASVYEKCKPPLMFTQADEALFAAKAIGRNQVVCYSEIVNVSKVDSDQLEVISLENKARVMSERVTSFVTQQSKRIMQTLHKEANTDALTQLFNRRYLDKQLAADFNLAIVNGKNLCIALVDLDHFGEINKAHGWPTGDKALCTVAETITQSIRATDWVGRYGGEEICIVMPYTNLEQAVIICERVRIAIASTSLQTPAEKPLNVTVSIGVVELDRDSDQSLPQLIERVSQLTLKAKSRGRDQVQS